MAAPLLLCVAATACGAEPAAGTGSLRVDVGYADTRTTPAPGSFPAPWAGAHGVRFVGRGPSYAGGALRIENPSGRDLHLDRVAVTAPGGRWSPWPAGQLIPAHGSLILTQTAPGNLATARGGGACTAPSNAVPQVEVTADGRRLVLRDEGRVLTNGGRDVTDCAGGNASHQWVRIGSVPAAEEVREASLRANAGTALLAVIALVLVTATAAAAWALRARVRRPAGHRTSEAARARLLD